jgi:G6PDH family F420-dependent oxidoreductase
MTTYGYFLSSEEHRPDDLVRQAVLAEEAGFEALWISDHFHPWNDQQGQSPFVWSMIGAIALLTGGRFQLGVGTGENLNEHILGDRWPPVDVRLDMLEEAIEVMRALWTGEQVSHHGAHYTVENARLYSVPDQPVPVYVSGFGPEAVSLAARVGEGYCGTSPEAELIAQYRDEGGSGPAQAGVKVCWGPDREQCVKTAHRLWGPNMVPGESSQELPMPAHFEQAGALVTEDMVAEKFACGPDLQEHLGSLTEYQEAGYDEIFVSQIGPTSEGFFRFAAHELLPALRDEG